MTRTTVHRKIRYCLSALCVSGGLLFAAPAMAYDAGRVSSPIDVDTGLRCLTQFCDYVRSRQDRNCLCKKRVRTYGNRRQVTLDCKLFRTDVTCEP